MILLSDESAPPSAGGERSGRLPREFLLGFIKVHILHHAAQAPVYGLALIAELRRHGYDLSPGTLYPILHGLHAAGYLAREDRVIGGKVRRYYAVTAAGQAALDEARGRIRELVDEVLEGHGPHRLLGPDESSTERTYRMEELISPPALRQQQESSRPPLVLDVRGAEEYAAGHLPGARHVPADELEQRLGELPSESPVVTYCSMRHRGSSRSERAAALLREHGYEAHALDGGLPAWEAAHGAVERA